MSIRILTYSNPFKIDGNPELWDIITSHPHFCASDTLVQGLTQFYGRKAFSTIRAFKTLERCFLGDYTNNPLNDMQMFLEVSDLIRKWPNGPEKDAFLFNRAEVVDALQYFIPLKCNTDHFDKSRITREQLLFLQLYDSLKNGVSYEAFRNLDNLSLDDYKRAISECTIDEIKYQLQRISVDGFIYTIPTTIEQAKQEVLKGIAALERENQELGPWAPVDHATQSKITTLKAILDSCNNMPDSYYKKIVIHGVHRLTAIQYYMIQLLQRIGIEIIFVINYADNLPAIYNTWKKVYEWCDTAFEFVKPINPDDSTTTTGSNILKQYSGVKLSEIVNEKFYQFDNLTSFINFEVSPVFNLTRQPDGGHSLNKMQKQYYAVSSDDSNEILKSYYPDHFKEKPFLAYPIGQFILSLYKMWNFEKKEVEFDYNSLVECCTAGLFQRRSNLPSLLRKTRFYFSNIKTWDEYKARIGLLKSAANLCSNDHDYNGLGKLSFFSLNANEIQDFEFFIDQINDYSRDLFLNMSEQVDYLAHFKKLMEEIAARHSSSEALSATEQELILGIRSQLAARTNQSSNIHGNSQDLQDALTFFLTRKKDENRANWIVRDFEQIDGAVLLSRDSKVAKSSIATTYHFAMLSNDHMLSEGPHSLPWPLTEDLFSHFETYLEAISAITAGHKEHRGFLKYILFYGTFFSSKKIEFSYIEEEHGEQQTPYYLLPEIGLRPASFKTIALGHFMTPTDSLSHNVKQYSPSEEALELFSICPFKFLLHEVLNTDIVYSNEFQVKYYLSFLYAAITQKKRKHQNYTKAFSEVKSTLEPYFISWGPVLLADIYKMAEDSLKIYSRIDEQTLRRKTNFLVAKWTDPNTGKTIQFSKPNADQRIKKYLETSQLYPTMEELPPKAICNDCSFSEVCLRNYYDAIANSTIEDYSYE